MGGTIHRTLRTCNVCEAMCGMRVTVEDGRVTDIRGDKDDVFSRGHICPKGPAMREIQDDPDRLRFPMRRTPKGFVQIGWEEALAEAADRLGGLQREFGRNAVGTYLGNPASHGHGSILGAQLLRMVLRTQNAYDANSQDANPRLFAALQMFGEATSLTIPDIDRTRYFLVLGANPAASGGSIMTLGDVRGRLAGVRERGGRFVLFDPRRTETADYADEHHFIRPGSDAALLLGILHVIFAEKRYDEAAVSAVADGLAEIRDVASRFPPERVAGPTGVPADIVRRIAREFAAAESAVAYGRVGVCLGNFGTLASLLVDALNIVTGNFDRPGGAMFPQPAVDVTRLSHLLGMSGHGRFRSRVRGLSELGGSLPAACMAEEMETPGAGQIRGFIVVAGNPVQSVPNGERIARALEKLDFMVSVDFYLNETSRHAHIVLPPRYALERTHYDLVFHAIAVRNFVKWSEPVVPPPPGTKDEAEILLDLATRLATHGLPDPAQRALLSLTSRIGADQIVDLGLRIGPYGGIGGLSLEKLRRAPHGIDLGPMRPMRLARVFTKNKKAKLAPPAILADVPRLERFVDDATGPSLVLIGRRHIRNNNSWMQNLPSLVKGPDRSMLLMHPDDAARLGLVNEAWVRVESRVGAISVRLSISADVMPGIVCLPHGFGHSALKDTMRVAGSVPGANMNAITDDMLLEPVTGTAILNGVPVTVTAAPAG